MSLAQDATCRYRGVQVTMHENLAGSCWGVLNEWLVQFGLTAFVTLLVVVDPPGAVAIFVALPKGRTPRNGATVKRAVIVALLVTLVFLVAGR